MVQVLLDAGMDVNHVPYDFTHQPISYAVVMGDLKMVKFLLEKGADPDERDIRHGLTLLAYAARDSSEDIMLALLAHGAQIPGSGALVMAVEGNISVARLLLDNGADVNELVDLRDVKYKEEDEENIEEAKERRPPLYTLPREKDISRWSSSC